MVEPKALRPQGEAQIEVIGLEVISVHQGDKFRNEKSRVRAS